MGRHGEIKKTYTAGGHLRYQTEVFHDELNKYQLITGDAPSIVEQKAHYTIAQWDEMWARRSERDKRVRASEDKKSEAQTRSAQAQEDLSAPESILADAVAIDHKVDWDTLKNKSDYPVPKPEVQKLAEPSLPEIGAEPKRSWPKFAVKLGFLDRLSRSRRDEKEREAYAAFATAHDAWSTTKAQVLKAHEQALLQHANRLKQLAADHVNALAAWENSRAEYFKKRDEENALVDGRKALYAVNDPKAVEDYCDIVLSSSVYPDYFPRTYELDYNPSNHVLILDYQLPAPEAVPTLRQVRYVQSRDEFVEDHITQPQFNKLYDTLLYQIVLRTVHELFQADVVNALASVALNGYVKSKSPTTGQEINPCVMSLQVSKTEFMQINLANVDPKACFRQMKGVGSSKLHSLAPVAPILVMNRADKRFVASYAVVDGLSEVDNLAAMDWEDFEHLVRELFESEFCAPGCEVKVTRASRDAGVDAVIFDADPIRGGKIVIQAKRYTNTVGVSAVRDLYGTVINEGAMKGILVTTSDYGPDSYEFAKGKPLQLLNGGNLLHLLEKHGHRARIDLEEARRAAAEGAAGE